MIAIRNRIQLFIKIILCALPVLGLLFYWATIKLTILMIPIIILIYYKNISSSFIYMMKERSIVSTSVLLILSGVILSLLNTIIHKNYSLIFIFNLGVVVFGALYFLLIIDSINHKNHLYSIVSLVQLVITLLAIYILLYVIYSNIYMLLYQGKSFNIWLLTMNANAVAMVLVPLTILLSSKVFNVKKRIRSILPASIFMGAIISIILSNSRGAWIGLFCGLAYLFIRLQKLKTIVYIVIIVAISIYLVGNIIVSRFNQTNFRDYSILIRFWIWIVALKYISQNPILGLGPDAFRLEKFKWGFPSYFDPVKVMSTHNIFLEVTVNYGVLFLIGFLLLLFYIISKSNNIIRSCNDYDDKYLILSINASIIALLVHSIFDCGVSNVGILSVIILLFSMAVVVVKNKDWFTSKNAF
jgi:O-antigen ligase